MSLIKLETSSSKETMACCRAWIVASLVTLYFSHYFITVLFLGVAVFNLAFALFQRILEIKLRNKKVELETLIHRQSVMDKMKQSREEWFKERNGL